MDEISVSKAWAYRQTVREPAGTTAVTATEAHMRPQGDRFSVWSALAAVGIGIAGSWC